MRYMYFIFTVLIVLSSCKTGKVRKGSKKDLLAEKGIIASYLNAGRFQNVQKRLQDSMLKHPRDADFPLLMGLAQMALTNSGVAETYFRKSLDLKKSFAAELNLSSALIEQKKYKEAKSILDKLVANEDYRHKERAFHNLGYLFQRVHRHKAAVTYFAKGLKKNPTYHVSWQAKAKSHLRLKEDKMAYKALKNARQNCNACYAPVSAMVDFFIAKRNKDLASKVLSDYLSTAGINPTQAEVAKKRLAKIQRNYL